MAKGADVIPLKKRVYWFFILAFLEKSVLLSDSP